MIICQLADRKLCEIKKTGLSRLSGGLASTTLSKGLEIPVLSLDPRPDFMEGFISQAVSH